MRIFAFYKPIGPAKEQDDTRKLIELWKSAWATVGFDPVVFGPEDIRAHPKHDALAAKAASFPAVCGHDYQDACMVRFAMSHLINHAEWIVFSEYDVFPRSTFSQWDTKQKMLVSPDEIVAANAIGLVGDMDKGPGIIIGEKRTFDTLVQRFLDYTIEQNDTWEGKPNVSEMEIMRKRTDRIIYRDWVRCYGREGWQTVPICHIGNATLNHRGVIPRWQEIQQILESDK